MENWPKEGESFKGDTLFTVDGETFSYEGGQHHRAEKVRYHYPERIVKDAEVSALFEGLDRFPEIIQVAVTAGLHRGIMLRHTRVPDSIIFVEADFSTGRIFPGQIEYRNTYKYLPQIRINPRHIGTLEKRFMWQDHAQTFHLPIDVLGSEIKFSPNGLDGFDDEPTLLKPEKKAFPISPKKTEDYSVSILSVGHPLNTAWVLYTPREKEMYEMTFREFQKHLTPFERYKAEITLYERSKNWEKMIPKLEKAIPLGSSYQQAVLEEKLADVRKLNMDLKSKDEVLAVTAEILHAFEYRFSNSAEEASSFSYVKAYKKLTMLNQKYPDRIEPFRALYSIFRELNYFGDSLEFRMIGSAREEEQLKDLKLSPRMVEDWLDSILELGKDSLHLHGALFYTPGSPRSAQALANSPYLYEQSEDLGDLIVERFPQEWLAKAWRAQKTLKHLIVSKIYLYSIYRRHEAEAWHHLGTPDSLSPSVFGNRAGNRVTIFDEPSPLTREERQALQDRIDDLRRRKQATEEAVPRLAQKALKDAEAIIASAPELFIGYHLKAMALSWLDRPVEAQTFFCMGMDKVKDEEREWLSDIYIDKMFYSTTYPFSPDCGEKI
ncbi:MAG: hypothetical protein AAFW00_22250 [Bacteroidota bacterium]